MSPMSPSSAPPSAKALRWRLIGEGKRLHIFLGGQSYLAVCGIGPAATGRPLPEDTPKCMTCTDRWALEVSLAADATLDGPGRSGPGA